MEQFVELYGEKVLKLAKNMAIQIPQSTDGRYFTNEQSNSINIVYFYRCSDGSARNYCDPPNFKITRNGTTPLSDQVVIFPKVILLCQRVSNEI